MFEADLNEALLEVQCSLNFQLLLLTRESGGRWQYGDSIALSAYNPVSIGLSRLIDPAEDDIVIHNDVVGYGTGIYQADFLVIRVSNRRFRVVLDTVEKGDVWLSESSGDAVQQESKFDMTPAMQKSAGSVTETLILKVGGKGTAIQREWDWRKDFGIFEPGSWYSIESSKRKAK